MAGALESTVGMFEERGKGAESLWVGSRVGREARVITGAGWKDPTGQKILSDI